MQPRAKRRSCVVIVSRGAKTFKSSIAAERSMIVVRVRVAGLTVRDGRVLLARHVKNGRTSYLLPGGGLEASETARDALVRELREEAAVQCTIGELLYVVEARSPNGSRHLLQLVFDVDIHGEVGPSGDERVAACEWHDIESLRTLVLHPAIGRELSDDLRNRELSDDLRGSGRTCRYLVAPWVM